VNVAEEQTPKRRAPAPARAKAVLAAHRELVERRDEFPVDEADQGDLATLLLVLIDLQHASLELAREQVGLLKDELAGLRAFVQKSEARAKRMEGLLKRISGQLQAGSAQAREQVELLDELVDAVLGREAPAAEEVEEDPGEGEGGGEEELDDEEDDEEPEEEEEEEAKPEVVVPDAILPAAEGDGAKPAGFSHPEAA
jgi:hypothetical protein